MSYIPVQGQMQFCFEKSVTKILLQPQATCFINASDILMDFSSLSYPDDEHLIKQVYFGNEHLRYSC